MKRIICSVIAVMLLSCTVPASEIDLSGLSYMELVLLKGKINLAIWNSQEWQEVEVPQGVWEVGADIPAGKWEIKALPGAYTHVTYGNELKNGGTDVKTKAYEFIYDPEFIRYDPNSDVTSWIIELEEGYYVEIDEGPAVFMPYSGKPDLGFK